MELKCSQKQNTGNYTVQEKNNIWKQIYLKTDILFTGNIYTGKFAKVF